MWNTSTAAVILGLCFNVRADGLTILCSERANDLLSYVFINTYKVAVNLLSPHMAFYSSCDLLHDLMQLYSNWRPAYFLYFHQFIKASCQMLLLDGWARCICGALIS